MPVSPVTTPVMIHSSPTVVEIVAADPPCLSIQKVKTAGVSSELMDSWRANSPRTARMRLEDGQREGPSVRQR